MQTTIKGDLLDYFPFDYFRKGQEQSINSILTAFESDYKYVLLDAPTGSGKSMVARTVIDYLSDNKGFSAYLLSNTKMLQNQYYDEALLFNEYNVDYKLGKGRNNFLCRRDNKSNC